MKFLPHNLSVRHLIILGMSIAILLLLLVGGLQWKSGNDFRVSGEGVAHTRVVLLDLDSLLIGMLDAETGQRGYLLTRQDSYLDPYNHSLAYSHEQFQALRQLITVPEQQKNLDRLEPLIKVEFDELAQTITSEQRGDHAGALQLVASDSGKNTMDDIRRNIRLMQDVETSIFQQREEAYQQESRTNSELSALLITLGLGSIVFIFFFLLLHRLEQMQELVTICAWSKLIEFEGEWLSMEEYLSRRLHVRVTHGISHGESYKLLKLLEYEKLKKKTRVPYEYAGFNEDK